MGAIGLFIERVGFFIKYIFVLLNWLVYILVNLWFLFVWYIIAFEQQLPIVFQIISSLVLLCLIWFGYRYGFRAWYGGGWYDFPKWPRG